jgi:tetratricopeptide (TPR) repeat protein
LNLTTRHRPGILLTLLLSASLAMVAVGCQRKGGKAFNKGQAHLNKKRYAEAISSFRKAVKQNPAFGEAYYNLGAARFQLAVVKLRALVTQHGSEALKAVLKATAAKPKSAKTLTPEQQHSLSALLKELGRLPEAQTAPIITLVRQALSAKLKARELFKKGKFVVIRKSSTRRSMLGKLDRVVRVRALLRKRGEQDRALWLVAVARPALLTEGATPGPGPRPQAKPKAKATGAKKP